MGNPKENPLNVDSLQAETSQGADHTKVLPNRLNRYSKAHHRAVEMAHYASDYGEVKLADKLSRCGSYLVFRDYFTVGKVRLHAAQFCKKHLLCPLCAIRRGAKMVKAYTDRLKVITASRSDLKPFLVTLTVKDGNDLVERFNHLHRSVQRLHKTRGGTHQYSEACKADAAVWSYEFKRGANSGEWHPHVHAVWLCHETPDKKALSEQWKRITGDSFMVDVRPFHDKQDTIGGFLEVFKYAVKFSDLSLEDNWHGFEALSGKRLIASFGLFRGVDIPEELTDERLDDLPYIEMLYRFVFGVGYSLAKSDLTPKPPAGKPPKIKTPVQPPVPYKKGRSHLLYLRKKHGINSS